MTAALLLLLASGAAAFHSPTLEDLELLAERAPDSAASGEAARALAGADFTGETTVPGETVVPTNAAVETAAPVEPDAPARKGGNTYIFKGKSPIKGINIYTPELDPSGDGSTGEPEAPEGPIKPWMTYGALGLGAALAVGGIWAPPLLLLGGILLGIGATLFFIDRKLKGG